MSRVASTFDQLLLATGSTPQAAVAWPAPTAGSGKSSEDRVIYYRTFADYERLRALAERGTHFAVVGGGFIGSEMAAAFRMNGKQVTLIVRGATYRHPPLSP